MIYQPTDTTSAAASPQGGVQEAGGGGFFGFLGGLANSALGLVSTAAQVREDWDTATGKTDQTGAPVVSDPRTGETTDAQGNALGLGGKVAVYGGGALALVLLGAIAWRVAK